MLTYSDNLRKLLVERIAEQCLAAGVRMPNWRTVHARVSALDAKLVARKRQDGDGLIELLATPGELVAHRPLEIVQIDHTPVDVFVVDAKSRRARARPWLTLAIDVHTRMVVGSSLAQRAVRDLGRTLPTQCRFLKIGADG